MEQSEDDLCVAVGKYVCGCNEIGSRIRSCQRKQIYSMAETFYLVVCVYIVLN